ncbi:MAG: hypothetical protein MRY57_02780 [Candidatus Pacebacteria bacterium]|nr:hypothetical protein [Candidatus Paceibacterota bacterium]
MTYKRLYKNFKIFLDNDEHLSQEEQDIALKAFQKPFNKRVFEQCIILLLWSVVALFIDIFIISGSATAAVVTGPSWLQVLPTLIFSAVNWIVKSIFVYFYMRREIPYKIAFLTGVQYIGFTLLLGYTLKHDPEFKHGIKHYLRYLKKKGFRSVIAMMQD